MCFLRLKMILGLEYVRSLYIVFFGNLFFNVLKIYNFCSFTVLGDELNVYSVRRNRHRIGNKKQLLVKILIYLCHSFQPIPPSPSSSEGSKLDILRVLQEDQDRALSKIIFTGSSKGLLAGLMKIMRKLVTTLPQVAGA